MTVQPGERDELATRPPTVPSTVGGPKAAARIAELGLTADCAPHWERLLYGPGQDHLAAQIRTEPAGPGDRLTGAQLERQAQLLVEQVGAFEDAVAADIRQAQQLGIAGG